MFKDSFKYYKSKNTPPSFVDVVDIERAAATDECSAICAVPLTTTTTEHEQQQPPAGLLPTAEWCVYALLEHPGLLLIRNPFTTQGQRYWMARCLRDYCISPPSKVNLNAHLFSPAVLANWWRALQNEASADKEEYRRLKVSMRWSTLGYHHNWDTKVYDKTETTAFPADMSALCAFFAATLALPTFSAEAAIVNYYPIGTTLAGHTDHSEPNNTAPLFSFSFGQTAIFLIGGKTKEEKPTALYLRSGDVMVMSGESRLCYHAVPRVMKESRAEIWNDTVSSNDTKAHTQPPQPKKLRIECVLDEKEQLDPISFMNMQLYRQVADEVFWSPFKSYLNDSRININVRQVHASEQRITDAAGVGCS